MEQVRVFIGYDFAEAVAYHTLCHSIITRSSLPVSITPIMLSQLKGVLTRERDPLQSNDFAFSRWLVPYLCGYEGWAIFMDCDMLVQDDIAKLWALRNPNYAVQVVKHTHTPATDKKYLGTIQTSYEKKNWSSVMLMNCSECTALTPEYVNTAHGLDLHQFKWLEGANRIGGLPVRWNYLVDYCAPRGDNLISNLHYTEGGPYFDAYRDCSYADNWWREYKEMRHCKEYNRKLFGEAARKVS